MIRTKSITIPIYILELNQRINVIQNDSPWPWSEKQTKHINLT